ncbi:MAG: sugar transferase [Litorimonas sp.]
MTMISMPKAKSRAISVQPKANAEVEMPAILFTVVPAIALVTVDALAAAAVIAGAMILGHDGPLVSLIAFAVLAQIGMKAGIGLYPGYELHPEAHLRKQIIAALVGAALSVLAATLLANADRGAVVIYLVSLAMIFAVQAVAGWATRTMLTCLGVWGRPVHMAGMPDQVQAFREFLKAHPEFGLRPVEDVMPASQLVWAATRYPDASELAQFRQNYGDILIVSDLPRLHLSGVHPAEHGWSIGLRLATKRHGNAAACMKRIFDIVLTLPITALSLPVILLAAALIRIVDPGPAFYVQTREGHNGKTFGVLKLRTMYLDADRMLAELLAHDASARAEWQSRFKLRHDPRILPVIGTFLRTSSLDELPQLFNILRGEMSLVGPRPFPDYHLAEMPPEFRARRASVMPGLTGLWQISERSDADIAGQKQLDSYYIDGRSFWADLSIFLRTFGAVLGGRGAY